MKIAEQLDELGCRELTFIGGEIFLYKGWEKIANYLSSRRIIVNLMSNGYKIGRQEIEQIKFGGLSNIGISLDGSASIHNKIRKNKDSFSNIRKSLDALNKAKIQIGVVTSLLKENFNSLESIYNFLIENNVNLWQIQLVNPMGYLSGRKDLMLSPDYIPELTGFIKSKNSERHMLVVAGDNIGYYDHNECYIRGTRNTVNVWKGCQAGITSVFIDSVGNIKGCGALYDDCFIEGNIREKSLASIWNDEKKFVYNRSFKKEFLPEACRSCLKNDDCRGGCRASNYFHTGSPWNTAVCLKTR